MRVTRRWEKIGPAVLIAVLTATLPACASPKSSAPDPHAMATAVTRWQSEGGSGRIVTLAVDFGALDIGGNTTDTVMAAGCRHLLTDIVSAQAYRPMPDMTAQDSWAHALNLLAKGAGDCAVGAETHNYTLVIQASQEFDQGTAAVTQATDRLKSLTGR